MPVRPAKLETVAARMGLTPKQAEPILDEGAPFPMLGIAPTDSLLGQAPMGRLLTFYGAKGGVGTTTIAIIEAIESCQPAVEWPEERPL